MGKEDWATVSIPRALVERINHAIEHGVLDQSNASQFIAFATRVTLDAAIDRAHRIRLNENPISRSEVMALMSDITSSTIAAAHEEGIDDLQTMALIQSGSDSAHQLMAEGKMGPEELLRIVQSLKGNSLLSDELMEKLERTVIDLIPTPEEVD
jgi:hypothetical protein